MIQTDQSEVLTNQRSSVSVLLVMELLGAERGGRSLFL